VPNTEFEGGDDGHGHGEGNFLVKQAQPSHTGIAHRTLVWLGWAYFPTGPGGYPGGYYLVPVVPK
jgi:hypothetical protein